MFFEVTILSAIAFIGFVLSSTLLTCQKSVVQFLVWGSMVPHHFYLCDCGLYNI